MDAGDVWRVLLQWAHLLAAVVWVGGSLFIWLVWRPAIRSTDSAGDRSPQSLPAASGWRQAVERATQREFREVVWAAIAVLVLTGGILTFDRLANPGASPLYAIVLAVKVAAGLAMFWLTGLLRPRRHGGQATPRRPRYAPQLVLALGCVVLLLAIVLRALRLAGAA